MLQATLAALVRVADRISTTTAASEAAGEPAAISENGIITRMYKCEMDLIPVPRSEPRGNRGLLHLPAAAGGHLGSICRELPLARDTGIAIRTVKACGYCYGKRIYISSRPNFSMTVCRRSPLGALSCPPSC